VCVCVCVFGVYWQEAQRQLTLIGKDYGKVDVQSIGFLTCGKSLRIGVADNSANLQLYEYAPQRMDSQHCTQQWVVVLHGKASCSTILVTNAIIVALLSRPRN
jgi:hypothetical protein